MAESTKDIVKPAGSKTRWLRSGLHDMMWVVLISMLIWMYADMEFTDSQKYSATLMLETGVGKDLILLSPSEYKVNFELAGSQSQLENFRRKLQQNEGVITLDLSQNYQPGEVVVGMDDLLNQACKFKSMGLLIKNVDQQATTIKLDPLEKLTDVPVELDVIGASLSGVPAAAKVDLFVPSSRLEGIKRRLANQPVKLKTKLFDLKDHQPGMHKITVEIIPIVADVAVVPSRNEVEFDIDIINPVETREMTLPVGLLTPNAWASAGDTTWEQYTLVRQTPSQWRPKVTISGESKDLNPANVQAFVQLTDDDKKPIDSWIARDVQFRFAEGSGLKLVGPAPKVMFRLEKRKPILAPTTPAG